MDVVGALREALRGRLHQLQQRAEAVVDVHHGEAGVRPQVALVAARPPGLVEDVDGVVGGAAAGRRVGADDAREAQRPKVQSVFVVVVLGVVGGLEGGVEIEIEIETRVNKPSLGFFFWF